MRQQNFHKKPHTARFLQTFHSGISSNGVNYRAEVPAEHEEQSAMAFLAGGVTKPEIGVQEITVWDRIERCERTFKIKAGYGFATEKQAKYALVIALTKQLPSGATLESLVVRLEQGFAKSAISQFIDRYRNLPDREVPAPKLVRPAASKPEVPAPAITEDGIYVDRETGRIFKVQFNKAQGGGDQLYAKQLTIQFVRGEEFIDAEDGLLSLDLTGVEKADVTRTWEYRRGLIRSLKPEWKLTPESAIEYGTLYGVCIRCNRDLTKESSIRQMLGDVCAGKSGF